MLATKSRSTPWNGSMWVKNCRLAGAAKYLICRLDRTEGKTRSCSLTRTLASLGTTAEKVDPLGDKRSWR
jgi:hypothetical protein